MGHWSGAVGGRRTLIVTTTNLAPSRVLADLDAHLEGDLEALFDLVRIPSVSADPQRGSDVRAAARLLATRLGAAGLDEVALLESDGHPVVSATWRHAGDAPTILIYGHYDVQPPDPVDRWETPPFEPTVRDDRVYARGVSDDKAPMSIALDVVASYLRVEGALPVNVVFALEGEEEIGSTSLAAVLAAHPDRFRADVVVSADGAMWRADHPSTMHSARGLLALEIDLSTASKDLHSGRHGGSVPNAIHALARLVAGLHDDGGGVAVAGFYDDVVAPTTALLAATHALPFDERAYLSEIGAATTWGEPGYGTLERQWYRPTLEINGMWGGYLGTGPKTVVPCEAHAKLTCRLVADQRPDRVFELIERHLLEHRPHGSRVHVTRHGEGAGAYHLHAAHPGLRAVLGALRATYGVEPWVVGMGGSVPICETFQRALGIDTVFFSFAVGDEDIHAPNEFFRLERLTHGRHAWADLLARLPLEFGA
ncbi:MAG: dipeptidase [Trueperaceae bacterium]|nr:MAG: dipeptidase [Trueperaceae bacterium]